MKAKVKSRITTLFWLSTVIIGMIYVLAYLSLSQRETAGNLVNHTYQVKEQIEIVQSHLKDAETGQRSYLITGDSQYLPFYRAAMQRQKDSLAALQRLTRDNPIQQQNLTRLSSLIEQRKTLLQEEIWLQRNNRNYLARKHFLAGQGMATMNAIRQQTQQMKTEEDRLLNLRERQTKIANNQILFILGLSAIAVLAMIATAFNLYHHLNRHLEALVTERTEELANSQRATTEYAQKLEQSNQELLQFAAVASHDLKAPLRKIASFSEMLRNDTENSISPTSQDYLERIEHSITRMQALIDDFLALSKVNSKTLPFQPVQLSQVVSEAVTNLQESLTAHQGTVEFGDLPTVMGDETQLVQMLQNLIENGLKYHREECPPVVKISSIPLTRQTCEITVEDNGIGIDKAYQNRIFNIFERLHSQNDFPGTGIGLAIVKKIIERHQGSVRVESNINHGSRFILTLPTAVGESPTSTYDESPRQTSLV